MTEPLVYSTAPVFEVEGETRGELARDVIRLEVDEDTSGLKTLTAWLRAQGPKPGAAQEGLLYLDGATLDFGKKLSVSIGPTAKARTIFQGFVSGLEGKFREGMPPEVIVFGEDQLMDLRMTRRSKTYENMSDAAIAESIAAAHGLSADADADGPTYDVVQQWNMSDLAFLRQRGALIQAEIWLTEKTLHFKTRDKRAGTEMTLVEGNHLIDLQIRADLAHQRTKVKLSGYDAAVRESIDEEAGDEAIRSEISVGLTGPAVLQRAFGERVSYRVREVPLKSAEASAWARAEMLRRGRAFVTATGVTRGSPDMVVGSRLRLEGVGAPFEGDGYYVTRVTHTYDCAFEAHRTRFIAERATIGEGT